MKHQSGRDSGQHGSMPTADDRGNRHHDHGAQGVRDRALSSVPQQPEVERYVIEVDGHRRDQSRHVEATRHVHEAGQDQQAQRGGGQMGRFIEKAAARDVERNPAVGRVECQGNPGEQHRIGPPPD
ncbi:MAG TPA: hypothetical protein VJV74_06125 [Terriglobia bacterium]|nr:hypothetical protein [Terriglobia bacterium]